MHENPCNAASQCEMEKKRAVESRGGNLKSSPLIRLDFSWASGKFWAKKKEEKKKLYKNSNIKEQEGKRWTRPTQQFCVSAGRWWQIRLLSGCFSAVCFFFLFYFHGFKPTLLHFLQSFTTIHSLDSRAAMCAASLVSCGFIQMHQSCVRNNCWVESRDQTRNIVLSASLGGLEAVRLVALQRRRPSHCNHRLVELFPQLTQLLM